jgi:SAM-dependent methyltransferase
MRAEEATRLERERSFHNERFAHDGDRGVDRFYAAIPECRAEFAAALEAGCRGRDVLEYGCGRGRRALGVAPLSRSLVGIDISDVAIAHATAEAERRGLRQARFRAMNAEALEFPEASFDLVYGSAIIHHLDVDRAYAEIARVLRPGGSALFIEPLGHNPLINAYRARTPGIRTADEHPLTRREVELARRYFSRLELSFHGLAALAAALAHGTPLFAPARTLLRAIDRVLFLAPPLRWQAWYAFIRLTR